MPKISPGASWLRLVGFTAALLLAAACLSPTLPLPPPDAPDTLTVLGNDTWEVRGTCIPGAEVSVLNEATGRGVVYQDQSQSGRYVVSLVGKECDLVTISQRKDRDAGDQTSVVLTPTVSGIATNPASCNP